MELVITKEFLNDFFISFDESNKYHVDLKEFLTTKIKGVTIITDLQDVTEWEQASEENPLWLYLLDIPMMTPEFIPTIETDIATPSFYSTYTHPYKLFLTSKDKNTCENLCKDYGFEYLSIENLEEKWQTYYSQRDDYNLPIDSISSPRFDNWAKLLDFKHPINSIVIIDKYLFCEFKQDGTKQFSHGDNLLAILRSLLSNNSNKLDFQLLIVTDSRNINIDDGLQPSSRDRRMNYIRNKLGDFIRTEFPLLRFDITVVNYDKRVHTTESEHDRGVYTNYFYFEIGTGLNILDCSGRLINRSKISFYLPLRSNDRNVALSGLNSIKTYLNDVNNHLSANPTFNRNKLICGSGNNRLVQGV